MASVNRVIVLGNLGQDPELRYTSNGTPVCTLSVATTDVRNGRDGQRQETTEWHRIIVWSKSAENCAKYLAKGRSVYVEGRLQTRSWDDKQSGQKRYTTEIVAQTVQFIGGGQQRDQNYGSGQGMPQGEPSYNNDASGGGYQTASNPIGDFAPQQTPAPAGNMPNNNAPSLDDIPF
ncbi:MAG: single-stranded DNA-binding protein [Zetaproteobacteria bacterium]|nr:single-stranded DNA-binding protein [Pseudobdellovibrionaceae bacterium]|tara:strand:+ start:508 stop:1035 length:528 start_codon:yes stop_codon:yes gene_type:complete